MFTNVVRDIIQSDLLHAFVGDDLVQVEQVPRGVGHQEEDDDGEQNERLAVLLGGLLSGTRTSCVGKTCLSDCVLAGTI